MKRIHSAFCLSLCLIASAAQATPIVYSITGLTFADGGSVSGTFTFDASTDIYTSWNITTTATVDASVDGGYPLSAASYVSSGPSGSSYLNPNGFVFHNGTSTNNSLALNFATPLTNAGESIPIVSASESQNFGFESRGGLASSGNISSNAYVVAAVPAPETDALMLSGLGVIGLMRYQQRKKQQR